MRLIYLLISSKSKATTALTNKTDISEGLDLIKVLALPSYLIYYFVTNFQIKLSLELSFFRR